MKQKMLFLPVILVFLLTACRSQTGSEQDKVSSASPWMQIELTDVRTGENFTIEDFAGKPILLESFAVWCPTCKKQQDKIKLLHEKIGDNVVSISVDIDPNEDAEKVLSHMQRNNFDWYFTVAPKEFTQGLIDEFGVDVVNAPQAPVILIDEKGNARLLGRGVKSPEGLQQEIDKGA